MKPVEWREGTAAAFPLAYAIVKSALVDAKQCDVAIRARTMSRPDNKDACMRAIYARVVGTRQQQGIAKTLEALKDRDVLQQYPVDTDRALRDVTELHTLVTFIGERFMR